MGAVMLNGEILGLIGRLGLWLPIGFLSLFEVSVLKRFMWYAFHSVEIGLRCRLFGVGADHSDELGDIGIATDVSVVVAPSSFSEDLFVFEFMFNVI